jgi:hypothetical protein
MAASSPPAVIEIFPTEVPDAGAPGSAAVVILSR